MMKSPYAAPRKSAVARLLKTSAAVSCLALAGCASIDPFAEKDHFGDRTAAYPTLRAPQAPQRTQQPSAPAAGHAQQAHLQEAGFFKSVRNNFPKAQIFRGQTPSSGGGGAGLNADSLVLNFEGASVEEAASLILGAFLQVAYEIHPNVQGVINLKSADALDGEAALGAFETVLRQNKAALVNDNGLYRIVPEALALGYAAAPQIGTGRSVAPGYAVQIVPLKFVAAAEMAEIIQPLAGAEAVVRVDAERNLLLLAGSSRELNLWLETINTFDIDWFAGKSVGVFPLRQVSAEQLVKELEAIFEVEAGASGEAISFLPIERTNSVMAITRAAPLLDKVRDWTRRLDADTGASRRLRVYPMKNAKAADVAPLLQEIFDAPFSGGSGGAEIVAPGETPLSREGATMINASTGGASSASRSAGGGHRGGGHPGGGLRIIPDEAANALLIMASQDEYVRISEALRQLDVAPLQVLVEATIVEVTITNDLRYGVQYFLEGSIAKEPAVGVLSSAASNVIAPTFPGASLVLGEPSKIVLDALEGVTEVNVISSPNLMVLDNQTARLVVGDQIPVTVQNVTNGFTSEDNDPVLFNSIEFRDTGVIFEVTPRITSDGAMTLDVVQEVSTVAATSSPTLTPTISQRRIESSIAAQSGQTIVLGGLFSDDARKGQSGVPIIQRAPLFGKLFSTNTNNQTRTELVVLIQPRILRNEAEARAITREFQDRVTGLQLLSGDETPAPSLAPVEQAIPQAPVQAPQVQQGPPVPAFDDESEVEDLFIAGKDDGPAAEQETQPALRLAQPALRAPEAVEEQDLGPLQSVLPLTSAAGAGAHYVQLGAYMMAGDAQVAADELRGAEAGLRGAAFKTIEADGIWRLLAGPFPERQAREICEGLSRPCAIVTE